MFHITSIGALCVLFLPRSYRDLKLGREGVDAHLSHALLVLLDAPQALDLEIVQHRRRQCYSLDEVCAC